MIARSNDFSAFPVAQPRPRFSRRREGNRWKRTRWKRIKGDNKRGGNVGCRVRKKWRQSYQLQNTVCTEAIHSASLFNPLCVQRFPSSFWSYTEPTFDLTPFLARFSCGVRNSKNAADDINDTFGKQWDNFLFWKRLVVILI